MADRTMADRTAPDRIRVSGFRIPRVKRRWLTGWVLPVRPRNLVWFAVLVALPLIARGWGTPRLLLATTSSGSGVFRFYSDCAYLGLDFRMTHVGGGSCPILRLLKS